MPSLPSLFRHVSAATLIAASAMAQLVNDTRADYQPMFLPSGPQGQQTQFALSGGLLPVIGQTTSMQVMAPNFLFGGIIGSFGAHVAQPLVLSSSQTLLIYVDAGLQFGTVPLQFAGGIGVAQWHVPPDPRLAGVDLAWQAYGIDAQGQIGTSNLLLCNVGLSPYSGAAHFAAFVFGPISISGNSYYESSNKKQAIISNETNAKVNYTITGTKPANSGPLELRDGTGAVISSVDYADTVISKTISVAANTKIYFYNNRGAAMNGVTWTIEAH